MDSGNGVFKEVFSPFDSYNFNDRFKIPGYPATPSKIQQLQHFEEADFTFTDNYFARFWTYYIPITSGNYKFHLVCNSRCSLQIGIKACYDMGSESPVKMVVQQPKLSEYARSVLFFIMDK